MEKQWTGASSRQRAGGWKTEDRRQKKQGSFNAAFVVFIQVAIQCWTPNADSEALIPGLARILHHAPVMWSLVALAYLNVSGRILSGITSSRWHFALQIHCLEGIVAPLLGVLSFAFKIGYAARDSFGLISFAPRWILKASQGMDLAFITRATFSMLLGSAVFQFLQSCAALRSWVQDRQQNPTDLIRQSAAIIHELLAFYLAAQSRPTNIPFFLAFQLQLESLGKISLSTIHPYQLPVTKTCYY